MLDLGFVSAILADNSFEEVVDFAAANNFKCVEMMCWPKGKAERRYAGVTHVDVNAVSKNDVARIKDYLQQKNIYISGLGYYPNPLVADATQAKVFLDHIKKIIQAAVLLDIPVVNTFIGRDHTKSIDDNFKVFLKRWPTVIKFAEDSGINIGIENCPMYFTNDEWPGGKNLATTPAMWTRMFEAIPCKNFGLNYDPSHMIWQQMDAIQPIYDFKDRIHHVHLKDAKLYKNKLDKVGIMAHPLEYHSPKLPGLGDVNWNHFFAALTDIRYKGPVCIEVEDKAFEGSAENIKSAILTARNYLTQFIA
ncbi:MAG: sugar phosphate isomerase/epimerase family protein [Panacibacter sp.]